MKMKNVEDIYPLSPMQEGILFHTRHDRAFAMYFEIITFTMKGDVDLTAFARAWQQVVDRHAVLRTAFVWEGLDEPVQVVRKRAKLEVTHYDWQQLSSDEQANALAELYTAERTRGFDLSKAPLMRVALIQTAADAYRFVWTYYHGLVDGWSGSLIFNDVFLYYDALIKGIEIKLPPAPSFRSYIDWVRAQNLDEAREYWQRTLKGFKSATPLELVRSRETAISDDTRSYRERQFKLDSETTASLVRLSRQQQLTLNTICQGAWAILLNRYSGEQDVVFGVAVSGRPPMLEHIETMIGMLVNTLPARIRVTPDELLIPWLKEIQSQQSEMRQYEYSPLVQVQGWSEAARTSPLFDSIVSFENHPIDYSLLQRTGGIAVRDVAHHHTATGYPINIIIEPGAELTVKLLYDFGRIDDLAVDRILGHLGQLLSELATEPTGRLAEFSVLTTRERQQVLFDWNNTATEYRRDECLPQLFEAQAAETPDSVAVIFGEQQLSYAELNRRANQVAHRLRRLGVGPEVRVGLGLERSVEMVLGVLAILKAGGVYVPLEVGQAPQRLQYVLADAAVQVVLTQRKLMAGLPATGAQVVCLDEEEFAQESSANPAVLTSAENLAYVIYTSGSTGTPKGVMVTHRSVVNLVTGLREAIYAQAGPQLRVSVNAPLIFDASVKQLVQLLSGHTLVVIPEEVRGSGEELLEHLSAQQLDVLDCTPSQLQLLLGAESWRRTEWPKMLLVGGESMSRELWQQLAAEPARASYNVYGPTECTVDAVIGRVRDETERPHLGRPVANTRIYLLDAQQRPVPVGVRGELCVAGEGLARGYLNSAEQTAEKFIPEPFSGVAGARMYRTGDLARWLEDGRLEFVGRVDHQVKVRGVRIELGEIEAALRGHEAVREAVVQVREDAPGDRRLIAYVVPEQTRGLPLVPKLTGDERDDLLTGRQLAKLPNGMVIAGHGSLQASGVYREIFEDKIYLKHGIRLDEGACVFDVGANIGLFTLFVKQQARGARVYSFEPLPPNFEALQTNVKFYGLDVKVFECGLSSRHETSTFTFYPHAAAMSGKGARVEEDKVAAMANVGSWLKTFEHDPQTTPGEYDLDNFVDHYLISESYTCQLRTLSEIIRDNAIERIDLLKLDVERSELDVLSGIEDDDWKKIRQFVIEVHSDELLQQITALLRTRGFTFAVEKSSIVETTGQDVVRGYMLYAWDPAQRKASANGHGAAGEETLAPAELSHDDLRNFLLERLPVQLIPSAFVALKEFPLTASGKVDRRALPAPDDLAILTDDEYVAPRTPVEEIVAGICAGVLRLNNISVTANFFDLGGHSLLAAQVISRVRETFRVELSLRSLFLKPTVEGLAENIEKSLKAGEEIHLARVEKVSREGDLPLSFSQQRIWFLDQMAGSTPYYNITSRVRLTGELNLDALQQACSEIIRRHEILRTTFSNVRGRPTQIISPAKSIVFEIEDVPGQTAEERTANARLIARTDAEQPFDLNTGPLLRIRLLRLDHAEHLALLTMHHIISDGWSTSVLVNELTALYTAFAKGEPSPLPEPPLQYVDYAVWQRGWLQGETLETQLNYWRQQLRNAPALLDLPTDKPRPAIQTFNGAPEHWQVGPEVTARLRELSRDEGVTLYMTLLAAFTTLLYHYSGQTDIVVGTGIANRTRAEIENLIGFFANMVLLRSDVSANPTFAQLLGHIRETALGAYAHQDLPFEKLVEELQPERSLSHTPFFNVVFVLQNTPRATLDMPGLKLTSEEFESNFTRFDLEFHLWEREDQLGGFLIYNTDLFEAATISRLLNNFTILLDGILADPDRRVASLPVLTADERRMLLESWNDTTTDYPRNDLIHRQFELQAARTPEATALVFGEREMSYGELNRRSNQLAHHLKSLGIRSETPVALCLERSFELVVALLGILKAGGYYVPLDPEYPIERLRFMLNDSAIPVVLTQAALQDVLPAHSSQVLILDTDWEAIARASDENLQLPGAAENLAYLMYTSGSTGEPKGVSVTHRGVLRLVKETNYASFGSDEVFLQVAPITFDASTFEIWGSLLNGGRLVIMPPEAPTLEELGAMLRDHDITTLWLTAGLFHLMVDQRPDDLKELRQLLAGGDVLSAAHVQEALRDFRGRLINGYGPTENTTFTACHTMTSKEPPESVVPIGRPVANTQVYLLNRDFEPVPIGAAGELYTGGDGLARGYHNRPDLTAERFIPHPYGKPGERLYRTGDRARYLPDGGLEFVGRLDQQVKVRGFRIELEEIEVVLATHPAVRQCIVIAREDGGREKRLVAYVLPAAGSELTGVEMRTYLGQYLPEYMIPSQLVVLEAFPLTTNGKVDRLALPAPGAARDVSREFVAPRTAAEKALVEVWQEVLGVERVSVNDNFFDLGGDSIRSIQVHAQAQERGYQFSVRQILQLQTIAELAREANAVDDQSLKTEPFSLVGPDDRQKLDEDIEDAYPLSLLQRGMLYHTNLSGHLALYHVIFGCLVRGSLDTTVLQTALQLLAQQHPVLRTSFDLRSHSEPLQLVHKHVTAPFSINDLRHLTASERKDALAAWQEEDKQRGFDWTSAPIFRLNVFILDESEFYLTVSFHHAILDGWSLSSMLSELFSLYLELRDSGVSAPKAQLATTFRDFIALERQSSQSAETQQYWSEKLATLPLTALPPREGAAPREAGRNVLQECFESELVDGLKSFARSAGVPLKSVLLAAHCKILGLLTGQSEVTTGLVSNVRPEAADGDRALGLFLNTVPFSLPLQHSSWTDLVQATAASENELVAFHRYPLAELQSANGGEPLFEATFNYTHFHILENVHESPDFKILETGVFSQVNFPFSAGFDLNNSELVLILEHDLNRISVRQIEQIKSYYSRALRAIVADPTSGADNSWALDEEEQQRLLVDWNRTDADYPHETCLHELIEAQAMRTPDAVALISRDEQTSYRQLNERANQLAHYLKSLGVRPETLVGVMLDRSTEMVVALLGILKAGAAYVPLDPSYPRERVRFMLEDAGVKVLVSERNLATRLPENGPTLVLVDKDRAAMEQQSRANSASAATADNLVYVIYTSGTTGQPKGAMLGHREVVNCVLWMQRAYALTPRDRMLCKTTLNFDPSVWEIFWPLLVGSQVVLSQPEEQHDSAALLRTIIARQVTIAYFVPSLVTLFLAEPEVELATSLTQVICGGESLPHDLVQLFYERLPHATLHHSYGPTETAIASAETVCERDSEYEVTPIGRPLANTQLYVLDQQMQFVPAGVIGELFIGGEGLGRGYLNRPDLTAQKFVPNPFRNGRLYRTGDMVRYLPDGNLEFHGRRDEQVKLRGVRIELGEIQSVIRNQQGVQTALVVLHEDHSDEDSLVAYVVPKPGVELAVAELRQRIAQRLPAAMVPTAFVTLAELPLLPNGKIDRKALPAPDVQLTPDYVAPRNAVEELIAGIWAEALDLERVSVHDDFFALGGHSLTATQVMARLADVFHVELELRTLFEAPTIVGLAQKVTVALREGTSNQPPAIVPYTRPELLPLSFAQQRLWFLEQLEVAGAAYHIPVMFRLRGQLDVPALERVVNEIMRRHESLRTSFQMVDGEPVQVIEPHREVSLTIINLSELPKAQREAETVLLSNELAQLSFDLTSAPLMHVRLVRLSDEEHVLQLTLHHLIADGWSIAVLARETHALYESFTQDKPATLPALAAQYADFTLWQREWLQGDLLAAQIDYWRRQLADAPRALALPTDHARPARQSFRGAQMRFSVPAKLTGELHRLSRREGTTIFMTLLTAYAVLLSQYADQDDVVIGTPIANRRQSELEDLIGFFANTLSLRVRVHPKLTFRELLRNVREVSLGAYAHQDVPFERLVEELQPARELNRNPFFQVTFGVQNIPHSQLDLPGLSIGLQEFTTGATRFDLECFLREEEGELRGVFGYSTDLFEQQTVENLLRHFEQLLEMIVANPKEFVSDLPNPFSALPRARKHDALVDQPNIAEGVQIAVETPTAELIANIWAEVLGLERVGLHNNFFDLGGHSLLATRVVSRMRDTFKLEVPLRRLFEMPTVFELATFIDGQLREGKGLAIPPIVRQPQDRPRPLSFAQQRLWFWEQLEPNTPTYNLTSALRLHGDLDLAVLEQTLNEIMRRHDILRTSFTAIDGEPVQLVAPRKNFRLNVMDISWLPQAEREAEARRVSGQQALRPFALNKAPLLRITLLRLGPQEHVAVITMHHIISDGWSMGILIDEVTALYEAYRSGQPSPLEDLPVQYADFAQWQGELLRPESEVLKSQLEYWKEQLRDVPNLELPTDRPRPAVYNPRGSIIPVSFSADLLRDLKALSRQQRVTLFMTLLAAFKVVLHSYSGQHDIVVGTDIANRTRVETEGLIGFFVNMLVLRTDLGGNPTFNELLQRIREVTLGAYAHQNVPFAKLVGELRVKRDLSRNPLFQVVCVLQNASIRPLQLTGLTLSPFEFEITSAPFDMVLSLNETADVLAGSVTYNTELFDEKTVRRFFSDYRKTLERVVADPHQPISSHENAFTKTV